MHVLANLSITTIRLWVKFFKRVLCENGILMYLHKKVVGALLFRYFEMELIQMPLSSPGWCGSVD